MPIPPPPPGGPPPPPTHSQSKSRPLSLNADRGALLSDICRGTKLRKVTDTNDRSAPLLLQNKTNDRSTPNVHQNKTNASVILQSSGDQPRRRSLTAHSPPDSKTPPSEHPYFRLYQYLQQGAPRTSSSSDKPKADGANGSAASSPSGPAPPITGLFPGGVPKLRTASDGSCSRPSSRPVAPRPPSQRHDDTDGSAPSSVPPSQCRRGNAPSPPINAYNREKPLPPTPPPASKPRPPTSGGNPAPNSLAPPPDLPQRHNSLNKRPAPSPTGHTPTRGPAPPPPSPAHNRPTPSSLSPAHQAARPPPPIRDPPTRDPPTKDTPTKDPSTKEPRATAPTAPVSAPVQSPVQSPVQTPVQSSPRPGCREAPPPPPGRVHGSPALSADPPSRGKPPPPPRTPAAPPPPPPPHRNGPCSSPRLRLLDDFESKYSFHPLDDFPPPEEYRHFTKIYPSKANRVMRGAPPLPPVAR